MMTQAEPLINEVAESSQKKKNKKKRKAESTAEAAAGDGQTDTADVTLRRSFPADYLNVICIIMADPQSNGHALVKTSHKQKGGGGGG